MSETNNDKNFEAPVSQNNQNINTLNNNTNINIHKSTQRESLLPYKTQIIKEWIGFSAKAISSFVSLFSIFFAIAIWTYLKQINATDLYIESVISLNGLAAVVLVATIFVLLITYLMLTPFIFASLIASPPFKRKKLPISIIIPYFGGSMVFIILSWSSLLFCKSLSVGQFFGIAGIIFGVFLLLPPKIFSFISKYLSQTHINNHPQVSVCNNLWRSMQKPDFFFTILFLFLSNAFFIIPFISLNAYYIYPLENWYTRLLIIICSILAYLPGVFYFKYKSNSIKETIEKIRYWLVIPILIILLLLPVAFITTTFKFSGIYNDTKQTFLLVNKDLINIVDDYFVKPLNEDHETGKSINTSFKDFTNRKIFTAYTRYNFGGTRLLCLSNYNPDTKSIDIGEDKIDRCVPFKNTDIIHIYEYDKTKIAEKR